jgi:predicted RNA-binding protein with EMAP domain
MNELNGKWTISRNQEYFNEYEYFDTKEEAIQFGKIYDEFEGKSFYIGEIESIEMRADSLGDVCIEYICQIHCDNDGEYAQEYLTDVETEHVQELDKLIEKVVLDWATKHDYHPKHFLVQNVEFIEV